MSELVREIVYFVAFKTRGDGPTKELKCKCEKLSFISNFFFFLTQCARNHGPTINWGSHFKGVIQDVPKFGNLLFQFLNLKNFSHRTHHMF